MAATHHACVLRAITHRLSSAHTEQVPSLVASLIPSLIDCAPFISTIDNVGKPQNAKSTDASLLKRLKVQTTSFLSDKTPKKRWAAVVLIKTLVDIGGWQMLQESGSWIRGLVGLLSRKDEPLSTKKLAIFALTDVFQRTRDFQTLVRELTTPNLGPFVSACLGIMEPKSKDASAATLPHLKAKTSLSTTILESFAALLPHHPTVFRTFVPQIKAVLLTILAPVSLTISQSAQNAARSLFSLLHYCAPKSSGSLEWSGTVDFLIKDIHHTSSHVFRAVQEDYRPFQGSPSVSISAGGEPALVSSKLDLPTWSGIHAGCERLVSLTHLLQGFMLSQTNSQIPIPIADVTDLILRQLSVAVPSANSIENLRPNDQIGRDEREGLWSELPTIHVASIQLISTLIERFGTACLPLATLFVNQIAWTFRRERFSTPLRSACYTAIAKIVEIAGLGFRREHVKQLTPLLEACCQDLLPDTNPEPQLSASPASNNPGKQNNNPINADELLGKPTKGISSSSSHNMPTILTTSALELLTAFLARFPAQHMTSSARNLADRTAVLVSHPTALLASTLNPPHSLGQAKTSSSLLTLLARSHPSALATEGMIRPRMPLVNMHHVTDDQDSIDDEDDGAVQDIELEPEALLHADEPPPRLEHEDALPSSTADAQMSDTAAFTQGLKEDDHAMIEAGKGADRGENEAHARHGLLKRNNAAVADINYPKRARLNHDQQSHPTDMESQTAFDESNHQKSNDNQVLDEEAHGPQSLTESGRASADTKEGPRNDYKAANRANEQDEDEDNDDDFEIPPLTMEADTDED